MSKVTKLVGNRKAGCVTWPCVWQEHWVRSERWVPWCDHGQASKPETWFSHPKNGKIIFCHKGLLRDQKKEKAFCKCNTLFKTGLPGILIIQLVKEHTLKLYI